VSAAPDAVVPGFSEIAKALFWRPLPYAARADESSLDKPQTSLKRIDVPNPKMLQTRDRGGANFFCTSNSSVPIGKTATRHVVALRFAPIVNQGVG
jgi:hypothetical protein